MSKRLKKESLERGIERVTCPKTTDGKIWDSEEEALEHQKVLDFDEFYLESPLARVADETGTMEEESDAIRQWLKENQWQVFRFLGV